MRLPKGRYELEAVMVEFCQKCGRFTIHYVYREVDTRAVVEICAKCEPDRPN